ncbi:kinase-like protein [Rhizophagus irregularis]|uniref:Kinase-like protein n=1 Tax=Rhizophagus irregularis TaxID=588596 RepID=A0A2I1HC87_9GLOM|nr:kinase-like protein [Rhizophagus irregularis]
MTSVKEWIEEKIKNGRRFGIVNKAIPYKKNSGKNSVKIQKRKHNEFNDELVKELKLLREVDNLNINHFLGIIKDSEYYILVVLEYANGGNLKGYLNKNLEWNDKIRMVLDITTGLKFLHFKEIIHRLALKDILVNNGKLIIADFGLSKKLAEV